MKSLATAIARAAMAACPVACLVPCTSCERAPEPLRLEVIHDLVADLGEAEFSPGSVYGERRLATLPTEEIREGVAYLSVPTGTHVTFAPIDVYGRAVLSFGIGASWTADGVPERPVRFTIEARPADSEADVFTPLFDQVLGPEDLGAESRIARSEIVLQEEGYSRIVLRLTTAATGGGERLAWPAWFTPQVRSMGREVALDDHPVVVEEVHADLLLELDQAAVTRETAQQPVQLARIDPAPGVATLGGARACIRTAAPARVSYRVTVPQDAFLRFAVGMDAESGWSRPGDGMRFAVEIAGARLFDRMLDPAAAVLDRGWHSAQIELARFASREVTLDLLAEPGADAANDVGGFASAAVVRRREVRRLRAAQAPTVLMILVDTLRADRLGVLGHADGLTPNIDAMARAGALFTKARTVTSWTWPTIASLFTGLYPQTHGVHTLQGFYLSGSFKTVAERFQAAGYCTAAFIASLLIGEPDNFHQGFETFVHTPYASATALNRRVRAWLGNSANQARFAYLHYFDPHHPYQPPDGWLPPLPAPPDDLTEAELRERLERMHTDGAVDQGLLDAFLAIQRARYDAEVRYFDHAFGELLVLLRENGVLDNCIIALTSDHGEEFMEHGLLDHGGHLYDETVRVPLIVTGYGKAAFAPRVITEDVEIRSLMFTLLRLAQLDPGPDPALGTDLLGNAPAAAVFGQTCHGRERGVEGWTTKYFVVENGWKLVQTPATGRNELFHLDTDPGERVDRVHGDPDVARRLEQRLEEWRAATSRERRRSRLELDEKTRRMLRELGYVEK